MAIQGVVFSNQKVSAADHATLFEMFVSDGVINGCATSQLRNTLTIASGMFVLKGRLIKIAGSEQITIPDSMIPSSGTTTIRLTGVVDISLPSTETEFQQFYFRLDAASGGSYPALKQESINTGNGHVYEVEWAILTVDSQGVITNVNVTIGESEGGSQGGGGSSALTASDFSFPSGKYLFASSGDNWELAFTNSGTFELKKNLTGVDIFVIGAGQDGSTSASGGYTTNHDGGNGGYYKNFYNDSLKSGSYNVIIGQTGGELSSIGDRSVSESDQYTKGGIGGRAISNLAGENGTPGAYAFGSATSLIASLSGRKYGASGGGGAERDYDGSQAVYVGAGTGAEYGSGDGGSLSASALNGEDALANSGSGGGGRARNYWNGRAGVDGNPGKGGSGIIIIRNHPAA